MEKTQLTGVLLLFVIMAGWWYVNAPTPEELAEYERVQDSIEQATLVEENPELTKTIAASELPVVSDSVKNIQLQNTYGEFAGVAAGTEEIVSLENGDIKIDFTNKGGIIKEALIKEHLKVIKDEEGGETKVPLKLLEDPKNRFEYFIPSGGKEISTMDMYSQVSKSGNSVKFIAQTPSGKQFIQTYTLPDSGFQIDYKIETRGITADNSKGLKFRWKNYLDKLELNTNFEKSFTSVYFKKVDESSDYCDCRSDDEEELEGDRLEWVSHVNQFFNSSLMADKSKPFYGMEMRTEMMAAGSDDLKMLESTAFIPVENGMAYDMQMYVGPNEFETLRSYNNGLEEIIPFGRSIFGSINRWIIRPAFNFLSGLIGSKGVVIIVLIFILKMILYPLMYKMLYSQAKMQALKPEIEKASVKWKEDPQKKQMETMKMYREYGVSPLGGCWPMMLQMPIWYALFRFFPASITFRQESFLWANDLSSYDAFINLPFAMPEFIGSHISLFTVLWAVSTLVYTYYNTRHMDMSANPAMKYVQYFMPLMFLGFFNTYASGLTCYMFFSNLFNIMQTVITKKFVFDNDKILAELNKEKAKPKKPKSGFQARIEQAMKQQQAMQAEKEKKGSKKKK